jgi:hypothetical protein
MVDSVSLATVSSKLKKVLIEHTSRGIYERVHYDGFGRKIFLYIIIFSLVVFLSQRLDYLPGVILNI